MKISSVRRFQKNKRVVISCKELSTLFEAATRHGVTPEMLRKLYMNHLTRTHRGQS